MNDDYSKDLSREFVENAFRWSTMDPEKRASREIASYANEMEGILKSLECLAENNDTGDFVENEFSRFREGYKKRYINWLSAVSRTASPMVTGSANFPTSRNQKALDSEHNRCNDLEEFKERSLKAIRKKLCPGERPIMAGDSDAVQRTQEELSKAIKKQDMMKTVNNAIRKHGTGDECKAALVGLGIEDKSASELLEQDCFGCFGFRSFELSNNNAKIRRLKARLQRLINAKNTPDQSININGVKLELSNADNRMRLYFDGKPSAEIRRELKGNGFRWAPSLACWQAYANSSSIENAKRIAGIV